MIKKIYGDCWNFLRDSKYYVMAVALAFLIPVIFGFIFPIFLGDFIEQFVKQVVSETEGLGFFQLFIFIFENNLKTSFIGMIFGVIFGIVPVIFALFNGYVLGYVMGKASGSLGAGVFLKILPHGVFEIPALILSLSAGLRIGFSYFYKKKKRGFMETVSNSLKLFLFVILPLLLIAAFIETCLIFFWK